MTEISEAAKRKACELANAESARVGGRIWGMNDTAVIALARVLQEHSDVAIEAAELLSDAELDGGPVYKKLQSLILPDEPCAHEISYMLSGSLRGVNAVSRMACSKCGKALKIVEAGDD